jgi:S-adenosylmethionine:tRNA ribosyltransferase-isomerase
MDLGVLDYPLDPARIAQEPLSTRDASRMMVLERRTGARTDAMVRDVGTWLRSGDVLVVNDAEVIAARLRGTRPTGGAIEVLLIEPEDARGTWRCMARGAGRVPAGERIDFGPHLRGVWGPRTDDVIRRIQLELDADRDLPSLLAEVGEIPLPPYIHRPEGPSAIDRERYQTVFARMPGAVAAPTAGLHFTPDLLAGLRSRGVLLVALTLLVGPATFLPIRGPSLSAHAVPSERYAIPAATAATIARARAAGGRVVAVGTTTVRALETAAQNGGPTAGEGRTDLVIGPGHTFRAVDALFTNFHLPRSSLLALVAAFAGVESTLAAYRHATTAGYRFYSYGDAMLIL